MAAPRRVLCIGAGPSGIVACNVLRQQGFEVTVYEAGDSVGGTFANKAYDGLRLVSSKFLTPFSDLRCADSPDDHMAVSEYIKYLEDYVDQFGFRDAIRFGRTVTSVQRPRRLAGGGDGDDGDDDAEPYVVRWIDSASGRTGEDMFYAVAVCSGLHNVPHVPVVPGSETFTGTALHSADYRKASDYKGKRVLVVGAGETAMDVAAQLVKADADVSMSIRTGFLCVPTVLKEGVPLDTYITNLFECSYEHGWVTRLRVKQKISTIFIRLFFLLATGSSKGFNQWGPYGLKEVRRGYHIINKRENALPYLNKPYKDKTFLGRNLFKKWDELTAGGTVDRSIAGYRAPALIEGSRVLFADGRSADFDAIIWCTGYEVKVPFLEEEEEEEEERERQREQEEAKSEAQKEGTMGAMGSMGKGHGAGVGFQQGRLPDHRNICFEGEPRLAFLGFVRPNVGAIPPMSELQAMWWVRHMAGKLVAYPLPPPRYNLLGRNPRTVDYAVDYGYYMHDLGRDIGSEPRISQLVWRPRALVAYCFGQAYSVFFRLRGPFATDWSWEVAENELYPLVTNRGIMSNLVFLAIIVVMAAINGAALVAELVFGRCLGSITRGRESRKHPANKHQGRGGAKMK